MEGVNNKSTAFIWLIWFFLFEAYLWSLDEIITIRERIVFK